MVINLPGFLRPAPQIGENMEFEYEPENCPDIPEEVVDVEDADNNPESHEVLRAPEDTQIIVNTTTGREMVVMYTEDLFIRANLADNESTTVVACELASLVMMLANMRYGGLEEAAKNWKDAFKPEVHGG